MSYLPSTWGSWALGQPQSGNDQPHFGAVPWHQAKPIQRRTPAWAHRSVLARRRASPPLCPAQHHTCARSPAASHARLVVPCLNARPVTRTPARLCAAAHARTRTPIHPMCEDHTDSWVGSHGLHLISQHQYLIISLPGVAVHDNKPARSRRA